MAVASLVLGIISCAFFWAPYLNIFGLACGIVAIVLSTKANKPLKEQGLKDGKVTAGLVTGIVGTALSGLGIIISFAIISTLSCFVCNAIRY